MKNYCLKVNEHSLYFKSLESIKNWFVECGVKGVLIDDEEQTYSLDSLEDIIGVNLNIVNECMCERGDDYCEIELEEFEFED